MAYNSSLVVWGGHARECEFLIFFLLFFFSWLGDLYVETKLWLTATG